MLHSLKHSRVSAFSQTNCINTKSTKVEHKTYVAWVYLIICMHFHFLWRLSSLFSQTCFLGLKRFYLKVKSRTNILDPLQYSINFTVFFFNYVTSKAWVLSRSLPLSACIMSTRECKHHSRERLHCIRRLRTQYTRGKAPQHNSYWPKWWYFNKKKWGNLDLREQDLISRHHALYYNL